MNSSPQPPSSKSESTPDSAQAPVVEDDLPSSGAFESQKPQPASPSPDALPTSTGTAQDIPWERKTLEQLAFASLEEQKKQRWWRNFFRFVWLGLFLMFIVMSMHKGGVSSSNSQAHTAVVEIKGEIAADGDASADTVISALKDAFEEDSAIAVVLLINSPGGSPVQAGMINDEIRRLKDIHKKPVYAVVEEMSASAAYYIAVSADEIYVDKASIVGSIGVLMDGFGFTGLMDKLGVERRLLTAGENKGFMDPFSAQSKSQKAYALSMLDRIHQQFIKVVRDGRGDRLKETPEMFSGLFWTGEEAVEMGLADHLGNLDFVAREVVKAEVIIDYTKKDSVAERLAKRFGAALGEGAFKSLSRPAVLR